jgi:hypothetical protein
MKTYYKIIILFLSLQISNGCTITEKSQRAYKFSVQTGLNRGGITENTNLNIVPNVKVGTGAIVDAYSGATRPGMNIGLHINKPLKYGEVESGLDYMVNYQTFTYADKENMYTGIRKLSVSQFMIPVTYNFILFKKLLPSLDIQFKCGYLVQINYVSGKDSGILPDYSVIKLSNGVVFGFSTFPVKFKNGSRLGFYIDAYRGSQIYEDYYNQKSYEIPGSSYIKGGLRFQFK